MERLIKALIKLLVSKGMELTSIPDFIRNLANTLAADPHLTLEEMNRQIHLLGWHDFDLDFYTLQLILATFESDATPRASTHAEICPVPLKVPSPDIGEESFSQLSYDG